MNPDEQYAWGLLIGIFGTAYVGQVIKWVSGWTKDSKRPLTR